MLPPMPRCAAARHLSADPLWAGLIAQVGRPLLAIDRRRSPYEALLRAIAHQQLHGRAAEAILARLAALGSGATPLPAPAELLALPEFRLRACGFSAAKTAALRDIATHAELERCRPAGRRHGCRIRR